MRLKFVEIDRLLSEEKEREKKTTKRKRDSYCSIFSQLHNNKMSLFNRHMMIPLWLVALPVVELERLIYL